MRIELSDNTSWSIASICLAITLCVAAVQGRACDQHQKAQQTERCKAVANSGDPVLIHQICRGPQ